MQQESKDTHPTSVDSVEDGILDIPQDPFVKAFMLNTRMVEPCIWEQAWKLLRVEIERRRRRHWTRDELRYAMLNALEQAYATKWETISEQYREY